VLDALVASGSVHLGRVSEVEPQRFLAHHVLSPGDAGQRDLFVREIRRGNDHRIDIGVVRDLLVTRRRVLDAPLGLPFRQQFLVGVTDGNQFGPRVDGDPRNMVIIGDSTGTDNGVANHVAIGVELLIS